MLHSVHDLEGYAIHANDGDIGSIHDFYFDDEAWVIRYLVVDTSTWLPNRKVLISPISIGRPTWLGMVLPMSITKEQIRNSPCIDTAKPVSRQDELGYLGYYGYPYYWGGAGLWGARTAPYMVRSGMGYGGGEAEYHRLNEQDALATNEVTKGQHGDPHLRSYNEVIGYRIAATDGDIGHVKGMLMDENTWAIRYLVVETGHWWDGHEVLIVPQWIRNVSWAEQIVSVNISRHAVRASAPYSQPTNVDRAHEADIYRHYGRTGYWVEEGSRQGNVPRDSP
jgi:uncharacterized protein YrrD